LRRLGGFGILCGAFARGLRRWRGGLGGDEKMRDEGGSVFSFLKGFHLWRDAWGKGRVGWEGLSCGRRVLFLVSLDSGQAGVGEVVIQANVICLVKGRMWDMFRSTRTRKVLLKRPSIGVQAQHGWDWIRKGKLGTNKTERPHGQKEITFR
jgi:hypothetical protein